MLQIRLGFTKKKSSRLINNQVVANMNDLHLIMVDDIRDLRLDYERLYEDTPEEKKVWYFLVSSCLKVLKVLIEWFNSYHQAFGHSPELGD